MTDQNGAVRRVVLEPGSEPESHREPQNLVLNPRADDPCPVCGAGKLDYDGLLNLACPVCGFSLGGCFT